MRVKKYLALTLVALFAATMLTACPWDIEDDAASDSSSAPSSSSRPSHDSSDDDSGSAPSSPSTPDEPKINVDANGALQLPADQKNLSPADIEGIKDQIVTVDLDGVTVEQGTFANCEKLTTVTLDGVTINSYGTFQNCENLRTVTLKNSIIGQNAISTFSGCRALTTVNGANTLETIPESMFSDCTSLQYIDISGAESIGTSAFFDCNSLEYIRVSAKLTIINNSAFIKSNYGTVITFVPMELTVYCTGSKEEANAQLEEWFKDDDICGETNGYPKFEYDCTDERWSSIVSQNLPTAPEAGNALARYLLDLRL